MSRGEIFSKCIICKEIIWHTPNKSTFSRIAHYRCHKAITLLKNKEIFKFAGLCNKHEIPDTQKALYRELVIKNQ